MSGARRGLAVPGARPGWATAARARQYAQRSAAQRGAALHARVRAPLSAIVVDVDAENKRNGRKVSKSRQRPILSSSQHLHQDAST